MAKPHSFMKGLFDSALGDVMGNIISDLGHELSDDVLSTRAARAFRAFDTDGSGRLEFHELTRALDTLPHSCRPAREADARALFRRFDADVTGALDVDEFAALVRCLRSRARLDAMPGVIYCGGELMNPSRNPELATRLLYSKPYEPWSPLARAIAKPTAVVASPAVSSSSPAVSSSAAFARDARSDWEDDWEDSGLETDDDAERDDDSALEDPGGGGGGGTRGGGTHMSVRASKPRAAHSSSSSSSSSKNRRSATYAALLVVRLLACLAPGYVHPDEYHQSVEVAAADVLGLEVDHPWEFTAKTPARSALAPHLSAGWTYGAWRLARRCWRLAGGVQKPAGFDLFDAEDVVPAVVFLAPRLGMFLLSLTLDAAAYSCAESCSKSGTKSGVKTSGQTAGADARIALASSWPVLVFAVRPFSNSLEACLLAVAALVTLARPRWYRWRVSGTLGFIAAIGIWTRFTFALLAIPLGLRNLESSLRFRVYPLASSLLVTCVGVSSFVATAAVLISADTAYYHGGKALVDALNDPLNNMFNNVVVAPLNSLRYNANVANLATHGLHPRGTHLAVNAPMMFGPLAFFAYAAVLRSMFSSAFTDRRKLLEGSGDDHRISIHLHAKRSAPKPPKRRAAGVGGARATVRRSNRRSLWLCTILYALGVSVAPHQEPRFLLPLVVPLAALFGGAVTRTRTRSLAWIAFNLAGFVAFGVAHQGGVVAATAAVPSVARHEWTRTIANARGAAAAAAAGMTNTNTNANANADANDDDAAESLLNGLESESASTPPRVHAAFWRVYTPPLALLARRSPEERDWSPGATLASTPPLAAWRRRDRVFSADVSGDFADDDAIDPGLDETRPALDQKSLHRVHAADLTGLPAAGVKYALRHGRCEGAAERGEACVTLLVAPVTAVEGDDALADAVEAVRTFGPHFSGEEMDAYVRAYRTGGARAVLEGMRLGVYRVKESA